MGRKAAVKPEDKVTTQNTKVDEKQTEQVVTPDTDTTNTEGKPKAEVDTNSTDKTDQVTPDTENSGITFDSDKKYEIDCPDRAGHKVYGCTGELITFDEKGIAIVCEAEAKHFGHLANCKIKEHKGE